MENNITKTVPGIIIDIDGVIVQHEKKPIPNAIQAMTFLKTKVLNNLENKSENAKIPFAFLTNAGGKLESSKAKDLNRILEFNTDDIRITSDDVILNFTPLRPILENQDPDKILMIDGYGDIKSIMNDCKIKRYITIPEYSSLFPNLYKGLKRRDYSNIPSPSEIAERLEMTEEEIKTPFTVDKVIFFHECHHWVLAIQVICDVTKIAKQKRSEGHRLDLPVVYTSSDDLLCPGPFLVPTLRQAGFNIMVREISKKQFGTPIDIQFSCKPMPFTFEYAKNRVAKKSKLPISNYYMIGDNPSSDIQGANNTGVISILVLTGNFKGPENHKEFPAKYIVKDILEAIKLICKLESIPFDD